MNFEWEKINTTTWRARTPHGWIVLHKSFDSDTEVTVAESMVLYPDPKHEWKLKPISLDSSRGDI
jgi:hypothetical protein